MLSDRFHLSGKDEIVFRGKEEGKEAQTLGQSAEEESDLRLRKKCVILNSKSPLADSQTTELIHACIVMLGLLCFLKKEANWCYRIPILM